MAGRNPTGPRLVHHLDGSERAKERLEVILETVAGKATIREACDRLGIEKAMFFRLRTLALQAGLSRLEPRPAGRPPRSPSPESERIAELEQELQDKEQERKATEVRLEIAQAMPRLGQHEASKKTAHLRRFRENRRLLLPPDRTAAVHRSPYPLRLVLPSATGRDDLSAPRPTL